MDRAQYRKAIKNYTTTMRADKIISDIQKLLITMGANGIMFDYDSDGKINGLQFRIVAEGQTMGFKTPLEVDKTIALLKEGRVYKTDWHGYTVALKNLLDWLDASLAMIQIRMVKVEQLFLPYMINAQGKTLYEVIKDNKFLLPSGNQ